MLRHHSISGLYCFFPLYKGACVWSKVPNFLLLLFWIFFFNVQKVLSPPDRDQFTIDFAFLWQEPSSTSPGIWGFSGMEKWCSCSLQVCTCFTGGRSLLWMDACSHVASTPAEGDCSTVSLQKLAQLSRPCVWAVDPRPPPWRESCNLGLQMWPSADSWLLQQ